MSYGVMNDSSSRSPRVDKVAIAGCAVDLGKARAFVHGPEIPAPTSK